MLYERYNGLIASIIRQNYRESDIVEDLLQEVFLKAFKNLKRYRGESSFPTWLAKIARNQCIDYRRSLAAKNRKKEDSMDDEENSRVTNLPDEGETANPENEILKEESKKIVRDAIQELPEEHRNAIILEMEGHSYQEISMILGIPINTVGTRIYHAKKKLYKILSRFMKGKKKNGK